MATVNIGDYMQTIAARNALLKCGIAADEIIPIDRDKIRDYRGGKIIVVFNACFYNHCFPIPENVIPIFVGFQASEDVVSENVDYLRSFEPIGCRDVTTSNHLKKHGVSAYITGCLTLSFDKRPIDPVDGRTVVVFGDGSGTLPGGALVNMPDQLYDRLDFVFQRRPVHRLPLSEQEMREVEQHARSLLDRYRSSASLVITPLHHAATPCMSSGIPVILCRENVDDRFSFIRNMIPIHTPESFDKVDWHPSAIDLEAVRTGLLSQVREAVSSALQKHIASQSPPPPQARDSRLAYFAADGRSGNRILVDFIRGGDYARAVDFYETLSQEHRDQLDANGLMCAGKAFVELRSPDQAAKMFRAALSLRPDMAIAHTNLLRTLLASGQIEEAYQASNHAESICWSDSAVLLYAARTAIAAKKTDAAIRRLERATAIEPSNFPARLLLAGTLGGSAGQWRKAREHARAALLLSPDNLDARRIYGETCLQLADWGSGFDHYKSRLQSERLFVPFRRPFRHQPWTRQAGVKKLLLLPETEQGIGFEVLAASLIPQIEADGIHVTFEATPKLLPILQKTYPNADFFPFAKQGNTDLHRADVDVQVYFTEACAILRRKQRDFGIPPGKGGHTKPLTASNQLRVGISWKSKNPRTGADRSIPLGIFHEILGTLDTSVTLVNLQYGDISTEIREFEKNFGVTIEHSKSENYFDNLEALTDTIKTVDIVVSSDNSTLFLAGLLNKQAFALLPSNPNWIWGATQRRSAWFPTIELFRSSRDEEWADTILALNQRLRERLCF